MVIPFPLCRLSLLIMDGHARELDGAFGGRLETMNHLPTKWRSPVLGIAG
jgi:hypothetical protein